MVLHITDNKFNITGTIQQVVSAISSNSTRKLLAFIYLEFNDPSPVMV